MKICYIDFIDPIKKKIDIRSTSLNYFSACGGNSGNIVHLETYNKLFRSHILNHTMLSDINFINEHDMLLIKCANQLSKKFNVSDKSIECLNRINIPIIVCCLGAQHTNTTDIDIIPADHSVLRFFKTINTKRFSIHPNISVRGHYTQKVLQNYGIDSTVTGCITSTSYPNNIGEILKNKYRSKIPNNICIAGNNPYNGCSKWLDPKMIQIIDKYNGICISQSPEQIMALSHGEKCEIPNILREIFDTTNDDLIRRWFLKYSKIFYNIDTWSNIIKLYDMVIGTRFHGVAIGIMNQIMGTIFTIDSRTTELAETSGIKYIPINELQNKSHQDIIDMSIWKDEDFAKLDRQTEFSKDQFDVFFSQNGLIV